jgi:hypothetical protein
MPWRDDIDMVLRGKPKAAVQTIDETRLIERINNVPIS